MRSLPRTRDRRILGRRQRRFRREAAGAAPLPDCLLVAAVLRNGVQRVHLAVPVPRVVAGAALTGVERAALRAGAEDRLVRRRQEERTRLRVGGLVEERL